MTFRLSVLLAGTALAVASAASFASGASAPPSLESWADTTHGWRFIGRQNMFGGYPAIQATENGGLSWHTVRRQASYGITEIQRTTASDGIVFVPRPRKPVLATTDNGRHWQPIPLVPRGFPVEASGRDVFWIAERDSRHLYRMRNALLGQTRTTAIGSLPADTRFEAVQPIPGGAAALANKLTDNDSQFSFVAYRYGTLRTFSIVHASKPLVCPGSVHTFSINWPVITVVADQVLPNPGPLGACMAFTNTVAFVSADGGATWTQTMP